MTRSVISAFGKAFSPSHLSEADSAQILALLSEDWPVLFNAPVPASIAAAHTAQAAAAVTPIDGSAAAAGRPPISIVVRWRRRIVAAAASLTLVGQMLIGSAALAAVGAGAAVAGVLPDPVQQLVADLGEHVGLELPQPADPAVPGGPDGPATPAVPASPNTPPDLSLVWRANPELRPVVPAVPAVPGNPGQPATPAMPAEPADPALENSHRPESPPGEANKPDVPPEEANNPVSPPGLSR